MRLVKNMETELSETVVLPSGKMTPNQIAEAQRLAREWKPKK